MDTRNVRSPYLSRISFWVARKVKTSPFMYRFWLAVRGRAKYLDYFPGRRKRIVIEGYPSCANSFITNFVSELTGLVDSVAHHTHSISSLKLSMKHDMLRIIILRDPLEAVASRYVRMSGESHFNIDIANYYLSEYLDFYKFVYENKVAFCVVLFETLATDLNEFYLSLPIHAVLSKKFDELELDVVQKRVKEDMRNWFVEGRGFIEYDGIPLPEEKRVQSRDDLKKALVLNKRFGACRQIHNLLREYSRESKSVK